MTGSLSNLRVIVAGAGALGSAIALGLAEAGARVVLADPAGLGDNASGVAAGMLAPVFEAVLDDIARPHFALLLAARDLWPDEAARLGDIGFRRSGAVWVDAPGAPPRLPAHARALCELGAASKMLKPDVLRTRLPGLRPDTGPGLFTPDDWRLEPFEALAAMRGAALAAGVQVLSQAVLAFTPGEARMSGGETIGADALVLATGADESDLAPELAVLSPIKGQILRYPDRAFEDGQPVLRGEGGYAVSARTGLVVGATMEPGLADRDVVPTRTAALAAWAEALLPGLAADGLALKAGVRGATPDGLPLVGPSERPGVLLAVGARRNGWLLAPLVARMTAAYLAHRDPGPFAGLMAARRFAPS